MRRFFARFFLPPLPSPVFFLSSSAFPPSRSFSTVEKCITGRAAAENGGGTCAASSSRGVELVCRVQPVRPSKNRWKNRGWRGNGKRFGRDKRRTDRRSRYPNVYYRNRGFEAAAEGILRYIPLSRRISRSKPKQTQISPIIPYVYIRSSSCCIYLRENREKRQTAAGKVKKRKKRGRKKKKKKAHAQRHISFPINQAGTRDRGGRRIGSTAPKRGRWRVLGEKGRKWGPSVNPEFVDEKHARFRCYNMHELVVGCARGNVTRKQRVLLRASH